MPNVKLPFRVGYLPRTQFLVEYGYMSNPEACLIGFIYIYIYIYIYMYIYIYKYMKLRVQHAHGVHLLAAG